MRVLSGEICSRQVQHVFALTASFMMRVITALGRFRSSGLSAITVEKSPKPFTPLCIRLWFHRPVPIRFPLRAPPLTDDVALTRATYLKQLAS